MGAEQGDRVEDAREERDIFGQEDVANAVLD